VGITEGEPLEAEAWIKKKIDPAHKIGACARGKMGDVTLWGKIWFMSKRVRFGGNGREGIVGNQKGTGAQSE